MNKNRNVGLDILRIFSMIMIISLHYLGHGSVLENVEFGTLNYWISYSLEALSIVAVNCYVLISAYFLIDKKFNIKKIIRMVLEVFVYSIGIYLILVLTKSIDFDKASLIKSVFPITTQKYWFISSYIALLFIYPFLNILIKGMDKKQHGLLLIILFVSNSIISLIPGVTIFGVLNGYSIVWFINLYLIAAYIKKYIKHYSSKNYLIVYIITTILLLLSTVLLYMVKTYILNYSSVNSINLLFSYNSFLVLFGSVSLFSLFLNMKIMVGEKITRIIAFFASSTLSVYLIHDNSSFRNVLWFDILDVKKYINTPYMWLHFLISILVIFVVCVLIDKVMRKTLFRILKKLD